MGDSELNPREEKLLREVVSKHPPDLLPLLERVGIKPLSAAQRESLRDPVATELVDEGFDEWGESTR